MMQYFNNGIATSGITQQQTRRIDNYHAMGSNAKQFDPIEYLRSMADSPAAKGMAMLLAAAVVFSGAAYVLADHASAADGHKGYVDVTKTPMAQAMKEGKLSVLSADSAPQGKSKFGRDANSGDAYGSPRAAREAYGIESNFGKDPFFTNHALTPQEERYVLANGEPPGLPDPTTVDGFIARSKLEVYDPLTGKYSEAWFPTVDWYIENSRQGL